MKTVAVIMSTYNGEKYLQSQIDSILLQKDVKNVEVKIYIRDDGSKDKTKKIIQKNCLIQKNVFEIDKGLTNVGVQGSFFRLLQRVEADYYFFSDQDDIWFPNKVTEFLSEFGKLNNDLPGGVYSDLLLVDAHGKSMGKSMMQLNGWDYNEDRDFASLLFKCRVTGAAFAINRKARDSVIKLDINDFNKVYMHDSFVAQLIAAYNNLRFIPKKLVFYRQHDGNVLGASNNNYHIWQVALRKKRYKTKLRDAQLLQKLLDMDSAVFLGKNKAVLSELCKFSNQKSRIHKIKLILNDYQIIWNRFRPIQLFFLMFLY